MDLMKVTKQQLKEMVKVAVLRHLNEASGERRVMELDRFRTEIGLSTYELLEDVLEQLDDSTWNAVMEGLREKYGYRL